MKIVTAAEMKDEWKKSLRRVLINGLPLVGKTTSLLTFPPARHIVIIAGEQGFSSVLPDRAFVLDPLEEYKAPAQPLVEVPTTLYRWEFDPTKTVSPVALIKQFKALTADIAQGKYGPVTTLALDGLHILYEHIMKAKGWTPDTDGKAYPAYHEAFKDLLTPILGSQVAYVAATVYEGSEPIEQGSSASQIFPELPGKMAKRVLGLFPVVIHAKRTIQGENVAREWRLQPSGKIQGAGVHIPLQLAAKLPKGPIEQNWQRVEEIINTIQ